MKLIATVASKATPKRCLIKPSIRDLMPSRPSKVRCNARRCDRAVGWAQRRWARKHCSGAVAGHLSRPNSILEVGARREHASKRACCADTIRIRRRCGSAVETDLATWIETWLVL